MKTSTTLTTASAVSARIPSPIDSGSRSGFDPSVPDSYTSTRPGACVVLARFAAVLGNPMPTKQVIPSRRCLAAAAVIISSADQLAVLELGAHRTPSITCSWSQRSNAALLIASHAW